MAPGVLIQTAEQAEYSHPEHQRYYLRDVLTALEHPELSLRRGRIEVGGAILPHSSVGQTATFYILSGEALCTLGDHSYPVSAGACCVAPAGLVFGLKNTGDQPIELLALFTPALD